jgi:hypothetical protein
MGEVNERSGNWLNIDPKYLNSIGNNVPGENRFIKSDVTAQEGNNMFAYLELRWSHSVQKDISYVFYLKDEELLMQVKFERELMKINRYLTERTYGKWPAFMIQIIENLFKIILK